MNGANIYSNHGFIMNSARASHEDFHKRLKRLYPCVDDVSQLPHGWSPESKAPPLGLTHDNLGCYYRSNGRREEDEKFAAAVRTDYSIPPSCLLYYYEIKFISKGREGFMGLGLTSSTSILNKLPGWTRESYGYHADDGNIFNGDGRGTQFGPTFTSGDIIGCGYNLVEGKCFFTKNGVNLGKAFDDIPTDLSFYPTIGLKTFGEEIVANFGQEDFVYDVEQDLRSLRKNMTLAISDYPINDFGNWQSTLHKLVQSWLLQNSYPNTAEAFTRTAKMECKENMQRIQLRNRIQQYVLNGKISEAIKLTNRLCPNLLQDTPNLLFALKCRQFVELISGAESEFQPMFNYDETTDIEISKFSNINNNSNNNNGSSSNGLARIDVNGDQPAQLTSQAAHPLASNTNMTAESSNINPSSNHLHNSTSNNGCNGMIGDNNCEIVDDQHSTSSSSYQELMDVDQNLAASHNSNTNDAINNHPNHNHNNHQNHLNQLHNHRTPLGHDNRVYSNDRLGSPSNKFPGDTVPGDSMSQAQDAVDPELDFNEQKFAKLISFGQELYDQLRQLDKQYGKNETNERMLQDAISLIAFINPKNSHHGQLLDPKEREPISQILNSSILKAETGESCSPPIEDVVNQLRDLVRQNNSRGRWLVDQLY